MKLHLIYKSRMKSGRATAVYGLFEKACAERDVDLVGYDLSDSKHPILLSELPTLYKNDALYRVTTGRKAATIQALMINDACTHLYDRWESACGARRSSWFIHEKYGLPVIPTYPGVPITTKERNSVIEKLGGYPIIVKAVGNACGVGVMRIDSPKSLASVLDYVSSLKAPVLLRKYIPHTHYVRAIVVGDRVVAANATYVADGEFRTNALDGKEREREERLLPKELQVDIVRAAHVLGIEAGGVDVLFDERDRPYIAEVNFPFDFTTAQEVTGIDIAGCMVDHMLEKNKQQQVSS